MKRRHKLCPEAFLCGLLLIRYLLFILVSYPHNSGEGQSVTALSMTGLFSTTDQHSQVNCRFFTVKYGLYALPNNVISGCRMLHGFVDNLLTSLWFSLTSL